MITKVQKCNDNCNTVLKVEKAEKQVSLDKLAQLGTNEDFDINSLTHSSDKKTLLKRARRKYFTNEIVFKLVNSPTNKDSPLIKSYWNTYHCSSVLHLKENGDITGKYCKSRWCMVCNAIRTGVSINKYGDVIKSWRDAHFVTLTQPTVDEYMLSNQMDVMQQHFKNICEAAKRRNQRGKGIKLVGIRKLECTYNFRAKKYHPHYHVIVESKEMAELLLDGWLKRSKSSNSKAQDIRKVDVNAKMELFKYMTKVVSNRKIDANSLDIIFRSMAGRRTIQSFGFRLPKNNCTDVSKPSSSIVQSILEWQHEFTDWIDVNTGETLTGYTPSDKFKSLFN